MKEKHKMSGLVSVIVPYFNSENTLANALGSIQDQEYEEIEIICVNDGSTDRSWEIANHFNFDKRIVHFSQENLGLGAARNAGMKVATGKYVTFVDSDDVIPPNYVQELMNCMSPDCDIAVAGYKVLDEDGSIRHISEVDNVPLEKLADKVISDGPGMACAKLYKKDFLKNNKLLFPENHIKHEDLGFTFKAIYLAKELSYTSNTYYIWHRNNGSLSRQFNDEYLQSILFLIKDNDAFLMQHDELYLAIKRRLFFLKVILFKLRSFETTEKLRNEIVILIQNSVIPTISTSEISLLIDRNDMKALRDIARMNVSNNVKPVKDAILPPFLASRFIQKGNQEDLTRMTIAFLFVKIVNKIFGMNYQFASNVTFAFLLYMTIRKVRQKIR